MIVDLVVDENILFAALLKESKSRELLFRDDLILFSPDFLLEEYGRYAEALHRKSRRPSNEFADLLSILSRRIFLIPRAEYAEWMKPATTICPDAKDIPYFALALKLKCGLWSNDKKLASQKQVVVWNTHQLSLHLP